MDWRNTVNFINALRKEDTVKSGELLSGLTVESQVILMGFAYTILPLAKTNCFKELIESTGNIHGRCQIEQHVKRIFLYEAFQRTTSIMMYPVQSGIQYNNKKKVDELIERFDDETLFKRIVRHPNLSVEPGFLLGKRQKSFLSETIDKIIDIYNLTGEQRSHLCAVKSSSPKKQTKLRKTLETVVTGINHLLQTFKRYLLISFEGSSEIIDSFWNRVERYLLGHLLEDYTLEALSMLIALQSPHSSCRLVEALIRTKEMPDDTKQTFYIQTITYCVSIGIACKDVLSKLINEVEWDENLEGAVRALIINASQCNINERYLEQILLKMPRKRLFSFLALHQKSDEIPSPENLNDWVPFPDISESPLIKLLRREKLGFIRRLLKESQEIDVASCLNESASSVTLKILESFQPILTKYFIPRHNKSSKLHMYGAVFSNSFQGKSNLPERVDAKVEAELITKSLQHVGVKVEANTTSWTTPQMDNKLRELCKNVKKRCSLMVVCVMSHGRAGIMYGSGGLTDECKINDILYLLSTELPVSVPKACQEVQVTGCEQNENFDNLFLKDALREQGLREGRSSGTNDVMTDAQRASGGQDDTYNVHNELRYPNLTLLMSSRYGEQSRRNYFVSALAEEIEQADDNKTVHDMFAAASHKMSLHPDSRYCRQVPVYGDSNRKTLIIPSPYSKLRTETVGDNKRSVSCTIL